MQLNILTVRPRLKCSIGIFSVWKKKRTAIRMIVGARRTNLCHQRPPHTALGTASAWTGLDLNPLDEDEVCRLQSAGILGQGPVPALDAHCSGSDIRGGFFQFSIPELPSWLGIDEAFDPSELGVTELYDEELKATRAVCHGEQVDC